MASAMLDIEHENDDLLKPQEIEMRKVRKQTNQSDKNRKKFQSQEGNIYDMMSMQKKSISCCKKYILLVVIINFIMTVFSMACVIYLLSNQRANSIAPTFTAFQINGTSPSPTHSTNKYYVGDYKISAQDTSHDNWLLCDGSFLDPRNYNQLFDVIGYLFGNQTSTDEYVQTGDSYHLLIRFALPDAKDRVIGINGDKNKIADTIGKESTTLSINHLPSHSHSIPFVELADSSSYGTGLYVRGASLRYGASVRNGKSASFDSNKAGSSGSFELYQPTIFVGNLFIYAGDQ